MFFTNNISKIQELDEANKFIIERNKELVSDLKIAEENYTYKIDNLNKSLKLKIEQATRDKELENDKLKLQVAVCEKENQILKEAFKNMWFEVKDMKSILDKLVDGIVWKNIVNIVK